MITQIFLIYLNVALGLFFIFLVPRRHRYFLNPVNTFWMAFLYFGAFLPAFNLEDYAQRFGSENVTYALFLYSLTAIFFYFGNQVSVGSQLARRLPVIKQASNFRLQIIALSLILIGMVLTLFLVSAYGGWSAYFMRSELRRLDIDVSDYFTLGPRIVTFAIMIGLTANIYSKKKPGIALYLFFTVLAVSWHLYHGSRSAIILMASIIIGAFYAPRMRTPSLSAMAVFLLVIAFAVGFLGAYRTAFSDFAFQVQDQSLWEIVRNSFGFLARSDSSGFANVSIHEDFGMAAAAAAYVPSEVLFDWGYQFLQVFTQWIPRAIWPGKIYPDGESWDLFHRAASTSLYVNAAGFTAGPAPTIVGKYYYAFGLPGVVIGSFLSGIVVKTFWCHALRLPGCIRAIFMIAIAPIGFMEANNPSLWLTFWLPTAGITLVVVLFFARASRSRKKTFT